MRIEEAEADEALEDGEEREDAQPNNHGHRRGRLGRRRSGLALSRRGLDRWTRRRAETSEEGVQVLLDGDTVAPKDGDARRGLEGLLDGRLQHRAPPLNSTFLEFFLVDVDDASDLVGHVALLRG